METNIIEMNQDQIVLTNMEIYALVNESAAKSAFMKIQNAAMVSGKTQYWIYKLWKLIVNRYKETEDMRMLLAKEHCEKDQNGQPLFQEDTPIPNSLFKFTTEGRIQFNSAFNEIMNISITFPILKIIIDTVTLEKMNNKLPEAITVNDMILLEKIFVFVE